MTVTLSVFYWYAGDQSKNYLILLPQSLFGRSPADQKSRGLWVRDCDWRTQFNLAGAFIFCKLNDLKSLQKSKAAFYGFCRRGCFFGDEPKNVIWKCLLFFRLFQVIWVVKQRLINLELNWCERFGELKFLNDLSLSAHVVNKSAKQDISHHGKNENGCQKT